MMGYEPVVFSRLLSSVPACCMCGCLQINLHLAVLISKHRLGVVERGWWLAGAVRKRQEIVIAVPAGWWRCCCSR